MVRAPAIWEAPMLGLTKLLPVLLLLGCGCPRAAHSPPPTAENERLRLGHVGEAEMHAALSRRLADMQTALQQNDAQAFAAAVVYPAYVNTSSDCSATVPDQEAFRSRFLSIVDPAVRKALLSTKEVSPWEGRPISVASDRIWFPVGERGFVFNTNALWSLPGLACWQETPRDLPLHFPLSWRVANVCWAEGESRDASFITDAQQMHFEPTRVV